MLPFDKEYFNGVWFKTKLKNSEFKKKLILKTIKNIKKMLSISQAFIFGLLKRSLIISVSSFSTATWRRVLKNNQN